MNLQLTRELGIGRLHGVEPLRQHRQPRLGRRDRQAGAHASDEIERIIFRVRQIVHRLGIAKGRAKLRTDSERHPDIGRNECARATESLRCDSDHAIRLAVDLKRAADKIVASALALPKSVARDNRRDVGVRPAFFGVIEPSAKRLHPHQRKIILRSQERETAPHLVIAPDACDRELERGQIGKHFSIFANFSIFVVGELAVIVACVLTAVENVYHLLRPHRDHRMQHHAVD